MKRLKVLLQFVLVLVAFSAVSAQQTQPAKPAVPATKPVTKLAVKKPASPNDTIIMMVKKGMSEKFIIDFLSQSGEKYDTSNAAMMKLVEVGVPENVINAMNGNGVMAHVSTALSLPKKAPESVNKVVTIPLGTEVKLMLPQELSSKEARTGQAITFEVADDLVVDDVIAIRKGARASGVVTKAVSQMLTRRGSLEFSIDAVQAVSGQEVALKATHVAAAGRSLVRGEDITIPASSVFTATVAQVQQLTFAGSASVSESPRMATSPVRSKSSVVPVASSSSSSRTGRFTIFVSAPQRDGFFDTTKEIEDSIKDIRELLAKQKDVPFTITVNREIADVVLSVVDRGIGSTAYGERVSFVRYYGGAQLQTMPMIASTYWVSSMLEVGKYKKEFTGKWTQDNKGIPFSMGAWGICASQIGRNVVSWVKTNAELINKMRS